MVFVCTVSCLLKHNICSVDEDSYLCVLYKDDNHTLDHVLYSLQRSIKCTRAVAQAHTTLIEKEVFGLVSLSLHNEG